MQAIQWFAMPYSQSAVDDLRDRLRRTRWPEGAAASVQDICAYWATEFDWQAQVETLSRWPHYRFDSAHGGIHFIHLRSERTSAIPLVLTHGWPGSFWEMMRIVPLLTESFHVVIPSLPGFGFSDRPKEPGMNAFRIADIWADMMTELGYARFAAQGGDLGAGVGTALGLRHADRIIGIHLNYIPGSYRPYLKPGEELTPEERAFLDDAARWADRNGAYAHLQATRPLTPAYGLNDSPAGLAAWILEKFDEWSDRGLSRDELLANVTLYWMTETIHSSFRLYSENRNRPFHFGPDDFVRPLCAIARFPKEISAPPRSWVERGYNVHRWTEMPRGGHFAAAEEPELLAADLCEFFSQV
jgi:pimeloyl-ACP methyl ester carboxylesterase